LFTASIRRRIDERRSDCLENRQDAHRVLLINGAFKWLYSDGSCDEVAGLSTRAVIIVGDGVHWEGEVPCEWDVVGVIAPGECGGVTGGVDPLAPKRALLVPA